MMTYDSHCSAATDRGHATRRTACWLAVVALALVLAGCMSPRPGDNLPPYGDSVRHTKTVQTWEPGDEVPTLHGAKAAEAMRTYRIAPSGGSQAPSSTQ
jgi:hypothetical protein